MAVTREESQSGLRRVAFQGDGVTLIADEAGDRAHQAVLFLHGGGQTRGSWGNAVRAVAARGYHALSLDLRGHGESGWSPDGAYAADRFVADLRAVCAALGTKPVLVGASMGGLTALLLVADSEVPPAKALVLVDVTPRIEMEGVEIIGAFMRSAPQGFASLEEAAEAVARYLPHRPKPKSTGGLLKNLRLKADNRYYWHWDPRFLDVAERIDPGAMAERLGAAARRIRIPALLVHGGRSRVVSAETIAEFKTLVPHAEAVNVADADHMVAGDRNDAFNAAIFDFLERVVPL
jgi:pimeloyl-ACP methyl ester carboxylesterase